MKNIIFLCTFLSSMNIDLSHGNTAQYHVQTLVRGTLLILYIHCHGDEECNVDKVKVIFKKGGYVGVIGKYGTNSEFCKGETRNILIGLQRCEIWKSTGLPGARIFMEAYLTSHDLRVHVTGRNVIAVNETSPNYRNKVQHHVSTILAGKKLTLYVHCYNDKDCNVIEVSATFMTGDLDLIGEYGPNSEFCRGATDNSQKGLAICEISESTGFKRAEIHLVANRTSLDVTVTVIGSNVLAITETSWEYGITFQIHFPTIEENNNEHVDIICKKGCKILKVKATFKEGGDMDLYGWDGASKEFCEGETDNIKKKTGLEKCVIRKSTGLFLSGFHPTIEMYAYRKSHNVTLYVSGSDVLCIKKRSAKNVCPPL